MKHAIRVVKRFFTDSYYRYSYLNKIGFYNHLSDEKYLEKFFYFNMGYHMDFKNPVTFNEKLQYLKVHDHNPDYTTMVDKYKVREFISHKFGDHLLIPLLGVWNDPDEIDFEKLPDQFVLKCNHNSGTGMCICKDKSKLDFEKVKAGLREGLKEDYYLSHREWPYKNVPRKIVCEQFMTNYDGASELSDYKLMVFHGKVRCSFTVTSRYAEKGLRVTFFDTEWNKMPFERHYPIEEDDIPKPASYDEMVRMAEEIAKDMPFARIDFYEINGKPYFGEITFYPGSGVEEFTPFEWDEKLGSWIDLSSLTE